MFVILLFKFSCTLILAFEIVSDRDVLQISAYQESYNFNMNTQVSPFVPEEYVLIIDQCMRVDICNVI